MMCCVSKVPPVPPPAATMPPAPTTDRARQTLLATSRAAGQGEILVLPYTRGSVFLSHGGQGESLVPPYARVSLSLSLSPRHQMPVNSRTRVHNSSDDVAGM